MSWHLVQQKKSQQWRHPKIIWKDQLPFRSTLEEKLVKSLFQVTLSMRVHKKIESVSFMKLTLDYATLAINRDTY